MAYMIKSTFWATIYMQVVQVRMGVGSPQVHPTPLCILQCPVSLLILALCHDYLVLSRSLVYLSPLPPSTSHNYAEVVPLSGKSLDDKWTHCVFDYPVRAPDVVWADSEGVPS